MKKKIILRTTIVILLAVLSFESYSYIKELIASNKNLEEVKTINIVNDRDKSIAIMVQDDDNETWHEAENRDSWPSPTTHGYIGAKCTDSDGAEIDTSSILQFNLSDYTAEINTKNTIYCTLYFAKGKPALEKLKETGGDVFAGGGEHTTAVDGMYRYRGTYTQVTNNYICFGTVDKNECLDTPETYMYRIIGITDDSTKNTNVGLSANQLKLIKAINTDDTSSYWSNSETDSTWDNSSVKSVVNGSFYNKIKNGNNGAYWDSMISSHSWYNASYKSVSSVEPTSSTSSASKIALMYATDYYNAGSQNTNSWLFITRGYPGLNTYLAFPELTMSKNSSFTIWLISNSSGALDTRSQTTVQPCRPVFYLQPGVNLVGSGASDDPFIITTMNNA